MRLYTLGLRKMGRNVEKASIAYLDTGEIKDIDVSKGTLKEAEDTAQVAIKGITSFNYNTPSKSGCKCDYKRICCYHKG